MWTPELYSILFAIMYHDTPEGQLDRGEKKVNSRNEALFHSSAANDVGVLLNLFGRPGRFCYSSGS